MSQAKCLVNALFLWALFYLHWLVPFVAFQMVHIRTRVIQAGRSPGGHPVLSGAQGTANFKVRSGFSGHSLMQRQGLRAHKSSGLPAAVLNPFSCRFIYRRVSLAAVCDFYILFFCFAPLRRVWLCPPCNIHPQGS